ncbi:alpha/beta hydrolase family protein [Silvibacterium acidisoli]|uniref:alpha/beta hydrolase family protein n=1 Tax=Acidobacteriaceae bacterium ZG23-2 TaxID=2883246 RepID=UPI00406BE72F
MGLVTNTFLAKESALGTIEEVNAPCAVATFDVATERTACVALSRLPKMRLTKASFQGASQAIQTEWIQDGTLIKETYRNQAGKWERTSASPEPSNPATTIEVEVRQSLNEPQALWAADIKTGKQKLLWAPNARLTALKSGTASVFHWRDPSGYEWSGGLLKPNGYESGHRYPLVIQTHGFNPHEFLVDGSYTTGFAARPLAAAGMMVLQVEDRRDRSSRPVCEEAASFADGSAAAIKELAAEGLIDPEKVGIIGFSRTSWYVETTLERYPDLFKAATLIDGIDQGYESYLLLCPNVPSCKNNHEAADGGSPFGANLPHWLDAAPSFNLNQVHTPLRVEAIR